jgi:putative ABC transport system permease protein
MIGMSGRFRSALVIGGQGIRARKLRTLLSMISLFLGVLAVVVVQAGASIAENALVSGSEMQEGKDGTILMYLPSHPKAPSVTLETLRGRPDAVAAFTSPAIIGEPGVSPVNPGGSSIDHSDEGYATYCDDRGYCSDEPPPDAQQQPPGKAVELQLTAVSGDIRQFRPYRHSSGKWLEFDSAPSMSPRLVINKEAAKAFARYRVPAEMRITGASTNPTPRIIGVVDDGSTQPMAYVRMDELFTWLPPSTVSGDQGGGVQVLLAPTASDLLKTLRSRLVAVGVSGQELHAEPIDAKERAESELALMRWIFLGLAGLVLLIGVAGILNVGLATVGERVEEFALRRAVGTTRSLLAGIVLAETLLTGLITAGAAIGTGVLGVKVVVLLFGEREPFLQSLEFPWQAGVAGIIAGLIAGVLGGLVPAIRAAGIPIATVMRA